MNNSKLSLVRAWKCCAVAVCNNFSPVRSFIQKKTLQEWKRNVFLFSTYACFSVSILGVNTAWGEYQFIELDLPYGSYSPVAINSEGQILGGLSMGGGFAVDAYIYDIKTDTVRYFQHPNSEENITFVSDINDKGQITGSYETYSDELKCNIRIGFIYNNGSFTDLPTFPICDVTSCSENMARGRYSISPMSINNNGDIVGGVGGNFEYIQSSWAFINDPSIRVVENGEGFSNPVFFEVNDNDIMLLGSYTYIYKYVGGSLTQINFPMNVIDVNGLNNDNKVVGSYYNLELKAQVGFVYDLDDGTLTTIRRGQDTTILDVSNNGILLCRDDDGAFIAVPEDSDASPTAAVNTKDEGRPLCALGNPINIGTGNKFQEENDYQGAEHTGLELTRYYNSQGNGATGFGERWTSTWHRLFAYDNAANNEQVYISRADGKTYSFTKNDSGAWESGPDDLVQLTGNDTSGWALVLPDDSTEHYSPEGQLQTITTRAGRVTTLTYDAQGNLTTVTGPFGHQLHFAYGDAGYISQVTAPDGDVYAYAHDANGNLISVTYPYPDGAQRQYLYENTTYLDALTGIIDANGNRFATYTYDDQGRVIETRHAGRADITSVTYGENAASVTLPSGGQRDISFETVFGQVKPITVDNSSCNCGARAYEYDPATGLLASRTDNNGSLTTYIRNKRGLETSRTEAAGTDEARTITTEWHASFRLPTKITDGARVTTFSYDQTGNLLSKIISGDGKTRSWNYSYNAYGQIVQIDGPRTDVADITSFTYDKQGNLLTVTNALGHQITYNQYDANGNLLQATDPNGLVTTYRYDERDRLIEQNIGGEITRYEFDPVGLLTKLTLPDDSYISYGYDAAHRLTSVSDTEGNSINYQLDEAGNVLKEAVTDDAGALVRTAQHAYDDLNRVTQDINAGGDAAQYSYDANGNVIGVTDEVDLTSQYDFDAFNRLIQAVNPATYQTRFEYNRYDEVIKATDPRNLKTNYSYDALGNRLAVNSPDSGLTSYKYDAAGNVVAATNAKNQTRQMSYDALNRLVSVQYQSGKTTTYGYDEGANGIGLMTSLRNNSSSTGFDYDQHGRLIQKALVVGSKNLITGYSYNDAGQLVGITYPSGAAVLYQYNGQTGKLSGIKVNGQTLVRNMTYEPFGPVREWNAGNGSAMLRTFNTDGRLTKQEYLSDSLEWAYDAAGKLVGVNDNKQQGVFSYYDDGALLSREFGSLYDNYTLDENDNRSYDGGLGNYSLYEISDDNNQILKTTPVLDYVINNNAASIFKYNATGSLIRNANFIMGYDETERMYIAVGRHSNDFALYRYDGLGERTHKFGVSEGKVLYAYDQDQRLIGEYQQALDSTNILSSTETIYMPDVSGYGIRDGHMPIGVLKDGQLYFVSAGQLGEPRQITDQSGQLVWSWQHDAFGKGEPDQRPAGASKDFVYNNRFPGQTYDAETGFFYNLNRYYDPNTGRYTRPDPIGLAGGMNPYVYVGGDPVNSVDPEGLVAIAIPVVCAANPAACAAAITGLAMIGQMAWQYVAANSGQWSRNQLWNENANDNNISYPNLGSGEPCSPNGDDEDPDEGENGKRFSDEKKTLVDMAKKDKRTGITGEDMQAYKDLNKGLSDPFPSNKVRGPEIHPDKSYKDLHGHVGPVNHIPIK